ncbi:hypothetical protein JL09_g1436 [Pichia kudriavzevii]|uniref:Uncharacterized protein n=1 Tax=Pichia kudriavzevii TaxID=4909 RepID=A0A099P354_PICKU|nr:hypothetical protein JL09_g1436 [Pichia kudriavzevii]
MELYSANDTSISRAGLRQTDITTQLESQKKFRAKTQSVMFNAAMMKSKRSLHDESMSVYSGRSGNTENMINQQLYHQQQYPVQDQCSQQQPQNLPIGQYPAGQYPPRQFPPGPYQSGQLPPGQYPPGQLPMGQYPLKQYPAGQYPQQYPVTQNQPIPLPKQRTDKKEFRESYMYLNQYSTDQSQQPQQQNLGRISASSQGSPVQSLQRRFSSQNGGIIGSPMSMTTEEIARKMSLNALMGVRSNDQFGTADSTTLSPVINYMNRIDSGSHENSNSDWESIYDESSIRQRNPTPEMTKAIDRLQAENRSLKKRLKDIELGRDASSIVAIDEKYSKLVEEYDTLVDNYLILETENKKLATENDSFNKTLSKVENSTNLKDKQIKNYDEALKKIIEKTRRHSEVVSESRKVSTNVSLEDHVNISTLTDAEIIHMLSDDVKTLRLSLSKTNKQLKEITKVYNTKVQEERKTIIVSSMQKMLHNEFLRENPGRKTGLQNFRIIQICPDSGIDRRNKEYSPVPQLANFSSPSTSESPPMSAASKNSMISESNSQRKLNDSDYSNTEIESEGEFHDSNDLVPSDELDFFSSSTGKKKNAPAISSLQATSSPIDLQFEKFN